MVESVNKIKDKKFRETLLYLQEKKRFIIKDFGHLRQDLRG